LQQGDITEPSTSDGSVELTKVQDRVDERDNVSDDSDGSADYSSDDGDSLHSTMNSQFAALALGSNDSDCE